MSAFQLPRFLCRVGRWKRRALLAEATVRELAETNTSLRNGLLDMDIISREREARIDQLETTVMELRAELWVARQQTVPVYEDAA